MKFLCEIEDVFEISSCGYVVVPGIPYSATGIKAGTSIIVETPDGQRIETSIVGIEMINCGKPMDPAPFLVRSVTKAMLPIGSRVYADIAGT
jgi:translation elongation factor EF-Tu-like GTPase